MQYSIYIFYRLFTGAIQLLPLKLVFRLGAMLGTLAYYLAIPFRRVVYSNLRIAFGNEKSETEIRILAKTHFKQLGANLLSCFKIAKLEKSQVEKIFETENLDRLDAALEQGKGVILVLSHLGNWELFAQICQFRSQYSWGTIYRALDNRYIENDFCKLRTQRGVQLFDRKRGFKSPIQFLRNGGALGILVDQHAGDTGFWLPFFGRLASTSGLAGVCALHTDAILLPIAIYTQGTARWKLSVSEPIPTSKDDTTESIALKINRSVETQIRRSVPDWFWVHNRWKTPKTKFLLGDHAYRICATGVTKPFRILIRSTNWLGDAVMTFPAIEAIGNSRPDAEITVLTHAKLADLWKTVPCVKHILTIDPKQKDVWSVATTIRNAGPFDVAIVLPNSVRSALEVWLAKVPRRIGYPAKWRRSFLNQHIKEKPHSKKNSPRHQRFHYLELARQIGANIEKASLGLEHRVEGTPLKLTLCPGAEYGGAKRWLPERFAEVAIRVSAQFPGSQWHLVGTQKDYPISQEILNAAGDSQKHLFENWMGRTSLTQLIDLLRTSHLLLTNDTGTMHLAAWLGVPVVAIFGSTEHRATGPVGIDEERIRVIRNKVDCSPCFLRECPIDFRCMQSVSADQVVTTVIDLLKTRC